MKKETEKYEMGTKDQLNVKHVDKSENEQTFLRIKKEINDLNIELS